MIVKKAFFQLCIVMLLLTVAACAVQIHSTPPSSTPPAPTMSVPQATPSGVPIESKVPTDVAFMLTKLYAGTAEVETQIGPIPNDATLTAIVATKYALNTQSVLTETAQPTETPFPPVPPHTPPCRPGDLKAQPYGNEGAGGNIAMGGGIVNRSASPCFLQDWPVFSLVDAAGRPLDVQYEDEDETYGYLLLLPGQSVGFMFAWGNWCGGEVIGGVFIRVFLPDRAGSIDIPPGSSPNPPVYGGGRCDDPTSKSFIFSISSFQYETNQP